MQRTMHERQQQSRQQPIPAVAIAAMVPTNNRTLPTTPHSATMAVAATTTNTPTNTTTYVSTVPTNNRTLSTTSHSATMAVAATTTNTPTNSTTYAYVDTGPIYAQPGLSIAFPVELASLYTLSTAPVQPTTISTLSMPSMLYTTSGNPTPTFSIVGQDMPLRTLSLSSIPYATPTSTNSLAHNPSINSINTSHSSIGNGQNTVYAITSQNYNNNNNPPMAAILPPAFPQFQISNSSERNLSTYSSLSVARLSSSSSSNQSRRLTSSTSTINEPIYASSFQRNIFMNLSKDTSRLLCLTSDDIDVDPIFVSSLQYHQILKRRAVRARTSRKIERTKHKSRQMHANRRLRGQGGRFLTKAEKEKLLAEMDEIGGKK